MSYLNMNAAELQDTLSELRKQYDAVCEKHLSLDMSRGKPGPDQMDVSNILFGMIK